jgi:hypothetical protein
LRNGLPELLRRNDQLIARFNYSQRPAIALESIEVQPGGHRSLLQFDAAGRVTARFDPVTKAHAYRVQSYCVFRPIVHIRSGIVAADFGIVTGLSGIVTDRAWGGTPGCA